MISIRSMSVYKPRNERMVVKCTKDDSPKNRFRNEFKNFIKKIQTRKMEQLQELQSSEKSIYEDFQEFHIASLKMFSEDIQEKINDLEKKKNKSVGEVIDE